MSRKQITFTLVCLFVAVSLVLSGCATAQPTEAPVEETAPPEAPEVATEAPAATEAPVEEKKVATFIWTQEFDTLNPLYTNMWFSEITQQLWLAWAWNFDENANPVPYLVTEMPSLENGGLSEDGKTITMKLRDDITWSDGTPLTSADFLFTYQMSIDKNNAVASAYPYDQVLSMEAPDDTTVVMSFEEPFAAWQATFWKGILPAHVLQPVYDAEGTIDNAEWNLNPTVGCGPYLLAEWESGSFARFVVNEAYWGPKPKIDEIFFRFVPDDASQVAALLAGDGDLGTFIAYSDVPKLEEAGVKIQSVKSGYNEGMFFVINEEFSPGMADVVVRQAIAMSINRQAIVEDLLLGKTGVPASYWDSLPYYNTPPVEDYPYDPEAAKAMLDEAGWVDSNGDGVRDKDGIELVFDYGTTIREVRQDTQAVVQQDLAQVGIKVELQSYDADIFFASYDQDGPAAKGEIEIMEWSDTSNFPDPDYYYWYCSEIPTDEYPAGANWQYYCNEELDELFTLQATQVNPAERQVTFQKINQIFHDEVVWLGLWQDPDLWAVGSNLQNYKFSGVTPFYTITEWDLAE
ncbi:MAG: peptide ABC transporter substrate-binding protein [Anaerolineales bacterium]|nr:peptide ABC transporter substrate-binding protein [Anaerolineales bacterium]